MAEYVNRQWLSKLGYAFDPKDLDVLTAEAFVIIGTELQRLAGEENGRQGNNRTRGARKAGS